MRRQSFRAAPLSLCVLFVLAGFQHSFAAESPPSVPDEIRTEAMRANDDPGSRPLPLACSWTCGHFRSDRSAGWRPENQMRLIEEGHYLLPWFSQPEGEVRADPEDFLRRYYRCHQEASGLRAFPGTGQEGSHPARIQEGNQVSQRQMTDIKNPHLR